MDGFSPTVPHARAIFTNRTMNFRSIGAVGFDMDYTLVHYHVDAWEGAAFEAARDILVADGLPVEDLVFDATAFTRGLVLDLELGNVVKANRFGYPKRAAHGMAMLSWREHQELYSRVFVDLREPRWVFLNTLFSLSEACLFAQLVDRIDAGGLSQLKSYQDAFRVIANALYRVHTEGHVKRAVVEDFDAFIDRDAETPLALLDLHHAGKKLALITNSGWAYTQAVMEYTFDPYLSGRSWRDLFDVVVVSARKPSFFTRDNPLFRVADPERGLLSDHVGPMVAGEAYHGGSASQVEAAFGLSGQSILYVGDHVFADVNMSKKLLRWRTGLVMRELEDEIVRHDALATDAITPLMAQKGELEHTISVTRLKRQRLDAGYGPQPTETAEALDETIEKARAAIDRIDASVVPLLEAQAQVGNTRWGPLLRAGNDKSHLARQVERYADFYTSRVSNLLLATPYAYLRSVRGNLPHDSDEGGVGTGS